MSGHRPFTRQEAARLATINPFYNLGPEDQICPPEHRDDPALAVDVDKLCVADDVDGCLHHVPSEPAPPDGNVFAQFAQRSLKRRRGFPSHPRSRSNPFSRASPSDDSSGPDSSLTSTGRSQSTVVTAHPHSWDPDVAGSEEGEDLPLFVRDSSPSSPRRRARNNEHLGSDAQRSEHEEPDEQPAIEKIYKLFTRPIGCSPAAHTAAHRKHQNDFSERGMIHGDLGVIVNGEIPDVLSKKEYCPGPCHDLKDIGPRLQTLFEGVTRSSAHDTTEPPSVCLHLEDEQYRPRSKGSRSKFDIDSFLGYATSLAAFKTGIRLHVVPPERRNIRDGVHITRTIPADPSMTAEDDRIIEAHEVRHIYFGSHATNTAIGIWIQFPLLPRAKGQVNSLSHFHLAQWYDKILRPAMEGVVDNDILQHIPSNWAHGLAQTKARRYEGRTTYEQTNTQDQSLTYVMQHEWLAEIWESVLERVEESGLQHFKHPQIFFSFKNEKNLYKKLRPEVCIASFREIFYSQIDMDFVDTRDMYYDMAQETTPLEGVSHTYMWRRCCLEQILVDLFGMGPRGKKGPKANTNFYHHAFLRDACNMTCSPRPGDALFEAGVRYAQFYSPIKEVLDAAKRFPFQELKSDDLAVDPFHRASFHQTGKSVGNEAVLLDNWGSSKTRTGVSIEGALEGCFSTRLELRMTHELLGKFEQRCIEGLEQRPQYAEHPAEDPRWHDADSEVGLNGPYNASPSDFTMDCDPHHVWVISTPRFLGVVRHNVEKYVWGFEIIASRHRRQAVSLDRSKLMIALIGGVRFTTTAAKYDEHQAFWWTRRSSKSDNGMTRTRIGLGWEQTLEEYGYCWWLPVTQWEKLMFRDKIKTAMMFHNHKLIDSHRKRYLQVQDLESAIQWMDTCTSWLEKYRRDPETFKDVTTLMAHIILRQYRDDVGPILRHGSTKPSREYMPFSFQGLFEATGRLPHLTSGHRSQFKSPYPLFQHLFGGVDSLEPEKKRQHFHNRGFRDLYRLARIHFGTYSDPSTWLSKFEELLFEELARYHWVHPAPEVGRGMICQTSKADAGSGQEAQRMVFAISKGVDTNAMHRYSFPNSGNPFNWHWSRGTPMRGLPPSLPVWLDRQESEWEEIFEDRAARTARRQLTIRAERAAGGVQ